MQGKGHLAEGRGQIPTCTKWEGYWQQVVKRRERSFEPVAPGGKGSLCHATSDGGVVKSPWGQLCPAEWFLSLGDPHHAWWFLCCAWKEASF